MKRIAYIFNIGILLFFIAYIIPASVFAETITLKSGQTIDAKIIEKTDKYIKIDFRGVTLTYYLDELESPGQTTNAPLKDVPAGGKKGLFCTHIDEVLTLHESDIDLLTAILLAYKECDNA